jgi:hypothetical protein
VIDEHSAVVSHLYVVVEEELIVPTPGATVRFGKSIDPEPSGSRTIDDHAEEGSIMPAEAFVVGEEEGGSSNRRVSAHELGFTGLPGDDRPFLGPAEDEAYRIGVDLPRRVEIELADSRLGDPRVSKTLVGGILAAVGLFESAPENGGGRVNELSM